MEEAVVGTRVSSSGQTTIPSAVRDALHVGIGDTIYWLVDGHKTALVSPVPSFDSPAPADQNNKLQETPLPSEWPSSFWATLGALDDPSFVIPPELDYADDAPRLAFD